MKKNQPASPMQEIRERSTRYSFSRHRQTLVLVLTILFSIAFIFGGWLLSRGEAVLDDDTPAFRARINLITHFSEETYTLGDADTVTNKEIYFQAEIISGNLKGSQVTAVQYIDGIAAINPIEVSQDDRILLMPSPDTQADEAGFVFVEYDRSLVLAGLLIVFLITLLLFGRMKGFRTILSLVFTLMALLFVFLPAILQERNIYLTTLITCSFIILMTLVLLNGANLKSLCAMLGNIGGLLTAGLLALLVNQLARVTGLIGEEVVYLVYIPQAPQLDLKALVWSGMLIGALGAVMDVAMSISSSMHEIATHMEAPDSGKLLKSGLRVGADVLGTMTNTLILAYIGSSLTLALVLVIYQPNLLLLLNSEMIAVEILQALIGSLGILAAIPITSLVASRLYLSHAH